MFLVFPSLQDWVSNVAGKQAAYHAMAEYYQGIVAKEKKEFGEEIARLTVSIILMCGAIQNYPIENVFIKIV